MIADHGGKAAGQEKTKHEVSRLPLDHCDDDDCNDYGEWYDG